MSSAIFQKRRGEEKWTAKEMNILDEQRRSTNTRNEHTKTRKQHNDKFGATPTESQQTTTPASNLLGRNARPKHQDSTGTTQNDAATTQAVAAAALAAAAVMMRRRGVSIPAVYAIASMF